MKHPLPSGHLHYEILGRGFPMLLMHGGLGLDHTTLRPWLDPLSERVQLIYYDHLGNGRSEFTGDPESLDHALWVETADDLRNHLGHDRLIVFGHSYGALLALEYALRYPQRVRGLILSSVTPALDYADTLLANAQRKTPDAAAFQGVVEALSGPAEDDEAFEDSFRTIAPLYFHDYDPDRHAAVLEGVRFRAEAANRATFQCLPRYDVKDRLGEIRAPTLVLSGADDWIMPPAHAGERVAAGIDQAEHVVFDRSGHWPFVEERDRYLSVVGDWLDRTGLSGTPGSGR